MKKQIIFSTIIGLQLVCQSGLVYGEDLGSHRAYKITAYNLGDIQDFEETGAGTRAQDFKPLLITSTKADILNSEFAATAAPSESGSRAANLKSLALSADFDATNKISLHGAIGVTRNLWTPDADSKVNGASWEANLGVIYKLLNNFSYEMHFGYMDTGDVFANRSSYSDVESIIMISNQLTLSF